MAGKHGRWEDSSGSSHRARRIREHEQVSDRYRCSRRLTISAVCTTLDPRSAVVAVQHRGEVMRTRYLLSLTIVVAAGASGCGKQAQEETASALQRDLTLAAPAPNVEIASPMELERPEPRVARPRAARRHVSARKSPTIDLEPIRPAVTIHASVGPTETAPEPVSGRELPPGKTVTLIPASSGPSTAADPDVDEGLLMIQRGHWCPPPRPGIGVTRPPALY